MLFRSNMPAGQPPQVRPYPMTQPVYQRPQKKPLTIEVQNDELQVHYGQGEKIDVYTKLSPEVMDGIIQGRMTFQRAFMTGEMTAKGNLKNLKMLDQIFRF